MPNITKLQLSEELYDIVYDDTAILNRLDNIEDRIIFDNAVATGYIEYTVTNNTVPHGTNTIVGTLKVNTTGLYYVSLQYRIGMYDQGQISTRLATSSSIDYNVSAYSDSVTFNAPTTTNTVIHQDRMQLLAGNTTYNIFVWHNFGVALAFDDSINWVNVFLLGKYASSANRLVEEDTRV